MQWSHLYPIAIEEFFSPKLMKDARKLNTRIEQILSTRSALDESFAKAVTAEAADVTVKALRESGEAHFTIFELLRDELALRKDLAEFDEHRHAERSKASDDAYTAVEATEAGIRAGLVALGYVDAPPTEYVVGRITPGMIHDHPSVRAARDKLDALSSQCSDRPFLRDNLEAGLRVQEDLARLRQRLAGM
jgi:hypothetical protein